MGTVIDPGRTCLELFPGIQQAKPKSIDQINRQMLGMRRTKVSRSLHQNINIPILQPGEQ